MPAEHQKFPCSWAKQDRRQFQQTPSPRLESNESGTADRAHCADPMKGNPKVVEELNKALREELTAVNQYFLHAEMCENWGYNKLAEYIKKQSIGEMKHAEVLIERILFLDGIPSMQPMELSVGSNVKDMIESDLKLELEAVKQYNAAVK